MHAGDYILKDESHYCSGSMTVTRIQNILSVSINTVCGRSYHTCSFEGYGTLSKGSVIFADHTDPAEKITVTFSGKVAEIREGSQYWCGMNASMAGMYIRESS